MKRAADHAGDSGDLGRTGRDIQKSDTQRVHGDSRAGWSMVYRILCRSPWGERSGPDQGRVFDQSARGDWINSVKPKNSRESYGAQELILSEELHH